MKKPSYGNKSWAAKIKRSLIELTALACLASVVAKILVAEIESFLVFLAHLGIVEQIHAWFS
jgi:hypothetical protein